MGAARRKKMAVPVTPTIPWWYWAIAYEWRPWRREWDAEKHDEIMTRVRGGLRARLLLSAMAGL